MEDVISMESNRYDTTNEQTENSAMGLIPGNVHNTANTLETIDGEMLKNITKGRNSSKFRISVIFSYT